MARHNPNFNLPQQVDYDTSPQNGCTLPKYDPGRKAWGSTQRALVCARHSTASMSITLCKRMNRPVASAPRGTRSGHRGPASSSQLTQAAGRPQRTARSLPEVHRRRYIRHTHCASEFAPSGAARSGRHRQRGFSRDHLRTHTFQRLEYAPQFLIELGEFAAGIRRNASFTHPLKFLSKL